MSRDRVKFFLPYRYFHPGSPKCSSNSMCKETCEVLLQRSFGMPRCQSEKMMRMNPDGFEIVCRPSQFARFIVYRYEADECSNGIKDLRPKIIPVPEVVCSRVDVSKNAHEEYLA